MVQKLQNKASVWTPVLHHVGGQSEVRELNSRVHAYLTLAWIIARKKYIGKVVKLVKLSGYLAIHKIAKFLVLHFIFYIISSVTGRAFSSIKYFWW